MRKWLAIVAGLICTVHSSGQSYSYDVTRNIGWSEVATVVLSDVSAVEATIEQQFVAPEPGMSDDVREIKRKLDAAKVRRFGRLDKNTRYDRSGDAVSPVKDADFDGLPSGIPGIPNDNNMAISNDGTIVSVINSSVSIFNENGDRLLYRTLAGIVGLQHTGLDRTYDPKVLYDPANDRFILVFLQGSTSTDTRIMVGFSQTSDPADTWKFYAVNGNPFGDSTWSDYPIIGSSKEDLFITVNILRDNESWQEGFTQSVIWQINKAGGYAGMDSLQSDLFHNLKYAGRPLWSICVVQGADAFGGPVSHFLTVRPSAERNDTLFVHTINNTWSSRKARYSVDVYRTDKPYGVPPSSFQPADGFLLQTNDTRVLSAFEHNGTIQYVQTSSIPNTTVSGIFHGFMTIKDPAFLVQANYITSDTFEYAYPSIAYIGDANNPNASVITCSHVSEVDYPGTSCIFHNRVDNHPSIYSSNTIIRDGIGLINTFLPDSIERWGDYTGIQRKYNEANVAWMSGSFGDENDRNSVWIGKVTVNNDLHLIAAETGIRIYPNPFVEQFNIDLDLEEGAEIEVLLYDAAGQQVNELINRYLPGGLHLVRLTVDHLNAGALRPGVYFVQIKKNGDETLHSQKIVIH